MVREMFWRASGHGQDGRGTLPIQSGAFANQDPRQGGLLAVAVGVDGDGLGVEGEQPDPSIPRQMTRAGLPLHAALSLAPFRSDDCFTPAFYLTHFALHN